MFELQAMRPVKWKIEGTDLYRDGGVYLEERPQQDGGILIAIVDEMDWVYDRDGDWCREMFPSNRTPQYFAHTRFLSVEEALTHFNRFAEPDPRLLKFSSKHQQKEQSEIGPDQP